MKAVMERFLVVPFSGGCSSRSSIDVVARSHPKRPPKSESKLQVTRKKEGEGSSISAKQKTRSGNGLLALPKHNISSCMQKLIRSVRSLSQVFVYKEEEEEDVEREIEIGYPTDVKHVTHIGLDGSTTINPNKSWDSLKVPEIISFPSISLRQFELAMATQAQHGPHVNAVDSSKLASA